MIGTLLRMAAPAFVNAGALRGVTAALNHLLGQHPNAATRLAAHAGRQIRMGLDGKPLGGLAPSPELWLGVTEAGFLESIPQGQADVEMLIKPTLAAGQALASQGVRGLSAHMRVEGDVLLAGLLGEIIDELAWDYEDDLSRVVGDRNAQRVSDALRSGQQTARDLGARAREQVRGVSEEAGVRGKLAAVTRPVHSALREQVDALGNRVADIEKRLSGHKDSNMDRGNEADKNRDR